MQTIVRTVLSARRLGTKNIYPPASIARHRNPHQQGQGLTSFSARGAIALQQSHQTDSKTDLHDLPYTHSATIFGNAASELNPGNDRENSFNHIQRDGYESLEYLREKFQVLNSKIDIDWGYVRMYERQRELDALRSAVQLDSDVASSAAHSGKALYVVNLATVRHKHRQWTDILPNVQPFYAVKCNPDPRLLSCLSSLGSHFDCASLNEVKAALAAGATPDEIIIANPVKDPSHLLAARELGVKLMTFDNRSELLKIKKFYPEAQVVLRVLVDDSASVCQMGNKYGAHFSSVPALLALAKSLNICVRGVSYHVGSGAWDPSAFTGAIQTAKSVFNTAKEIGLNDLDILDIGGGFPGQFRPGDSTGGISFSEIARALVPALAEHFPPESGVRVIGEPGRFFAASTHTLATQLIGRREPDHLLEVRFAEDEKQEQEDKEFNVQCIPGPGYKYYINEGLYSSFNCVLYDHVDLKVTNPPLPLNLATELMSDDESTNTTSGTNNTPNTCEKSFPASLWGPTCDGFDCVMPEVNLPLMETGDWLVFHDMGAYTHAAGSNFNGFENADMLYLD